MSVIVVMLQVLTVQVTLADPTGVEVVFGAYTFAFAAGNNVHNISFPVSGESICGMPRSVSHGCVRASDVQMWWPNDYGSQPLYTLTVAIGSAEIVYRIGFRSVM